MTRRRDRLAWESLYGYGSYEIQASLKDTMRGYPNELLKLAERAVEEAQDGGFEVELEWPEIILGSCEEGQRKRFPWEAEPKPEAQKATLTFIKPGAKLTVRQVIIMFELQNFLNTSWIIGLNKRHKEV